MIKVHHLETEQFIRWQAESNQGNIGMASELWQKGSYKLVATVDSDDIDDAYHLTQNIDKPWWQNSKVEKVFDGRGCRSTSVGDIMELEGGILLLVCPIGFAEVKLDGLEGK